MATLFISDLHLQPAKPVLSDIFLRFLRGPARSAEAVYILGDLFEYWVGDDGSLKRYQKEADALSTLTKTGVPVYFMHGNRDFLVAEAFSRQTGVKLLKDPTLVSLYGTLTVLTHGDSLCTDDVRHQEARKKWLDPAAQARVLALPVWFRRAYAVYLRTRSKITKPLKPAYIIDATQQAVEDMLHEHGVWQMIHGHTHRPAIHDFTMDGVPARRIVLSDWRVDRGSVLVYDEKGCRLEELR